MKLKQWLYGVTALSMLASCSERDIAPDTGGVENSRGSGYVSIAIGMPTGIGSRANDDFADGLADEYKVNNVAILFFEGREESAKFIKAYNVSNEFNGVNPDDDQITASNKVTFPVQVTETTGSLWALALINYAPVFTVGQGNTLLVDGAKFEGTIKDFMALKTNKNLAFSTQANFFMTNTPFTTAPGSSVTEAPTGLVHILAPVDKERIAETEALAKQNPAAEIFVERAVAKVTVVADDIQNSVDEIEKITWVIDNTEPESYIARNLVYNSFDATQAPEWMAYTQSQDFMNALTAADIRVPSQNYRFVGNAPFDAAHPNYRLYFGVDPQGNGIDGGSLKVLTEAEITGDTFKDIDYADKKNPQYCYENTFDVQHQDYLNTTRAILKVTFKGGNFYTRGLDRTTKYSSTEAQMSIAHFVLENADVVKTWTDYFSTPTTITINDMVCTFDEQEGIGTGRNEWLDLSYRIDGGRLILSSIKLLDGNAGNPNVVEFPESISVEQIINDINSQVTINAYTHGDAYYAVRIKHFGDDLTPWLVPDGPTTTTAESYPGYDANNYLGRYGVLRNNWYELNIQNIDRYGEPSVGDLVLDKTPDDKVEAEKAISCKINILSWAKRNQNVNF